MSTGFYITCAVFALAAYFIGGINAAIVLSKLKYGQDILSEAATRDLQISSVYTG